MFDEAAFREIVQSKGIKLKAVACAMGIRPSTLYRKMKGQSDFTRNEIQLCCEFLGRKEMHDIFFANKVS